MKEDNFLLSEVSFQKRIHYKETMDASKKAASSGPTIPEKLIFASPSIERAIVWNKEKNESSFPPSPVKAWNPTVLLNSFSLSSDQAGNIALTKETKKESSFPWSAGKAGNIAVPEKKESSFPLPTVETGKSTVAKKKDPSGLPWPFEPIVSKKADYSFPLSAIEARKPTVLMKKQSNGLHWPFGSTVPKKVEESCFPLSAVEAGKSTFVKKKASNGLPLQGAIANALEKAASSGPFGRSVPRKRAVTSIWDTSSPIAVQGDSLRTWSCSTPGVDRVQVLMRTEGRPLYADVELWQGPDNTPQKMAVYIEDGSVRQFQTVIETPGNQNSIAIRNTDQMEFPMHACVEADMEYAIRTGSAGLGDITKRLSDMSVPNLIQGGGAVQTYLFDPSVERVQISIKTDGRPLNARIELMQGPNDNKQIIELDIQDGRERPFSAVIETPGSGNVVRIVNTATLEFPMSASLEPFMLEGMAVARRTSTVNDHPSVAGAETAVGAPPVAAVRQLPSKAGAWPMAVLWNAVAGKSTEETTMAPRPWRR
jgi:hypothetical protein